MPEEDDEHFITRPCTHREIGESAGYVLAGRLLANSRRIALRLVGQIGNVGLGDSALVLGRVDERSGPFVKLFAVFRIALDSVDDEQIGVLSGDGSGEGHEPNSETAQQNVAQGFSPETAGLKAYATPPVHTNPLARRNAHSPPISPTSMIRMAGISHRSRSSTTVTPRPL